MVYRAPGAGFAELLFAGNSARPWPRLDEFAAKWEGTYPTISPIMSLREVIKTRGWFPRQEAALKLLYLALEHIAKMWTMPVQNGKAALQRFAIIPGDRVPQAEMA